MLCIIRLKLERTARYSRSSNTCSELQNTAESSLSDSAKESPNGIQTGDFTKSDMQECQSKAPATSAQSNVPLLCDSNFSTSSLATPPIEEDEEENIFQMFRSKNNNTLLDVLCDSLIKEGVTKKFASKNFDFSEEISTRDPVQRKPAGAGSIPCLQCDSTFSKFRYLKDHIKRKHEVHKCPVCGDSSSNSQVGVAKHLRRVHNLVGDQVEIAMNTDENCLEPVVPDSGENSADVDMPATDVPCDQNDAGDKSAMDSIFDGDKSNNASSVNVPNDLNKDDGCTEGIMEEGRKRKIKGTGAITCPHCTETFSAPRNLKDHIKRKHVIFACPVCGEDNFVSQKGVKRHMGRVHAEESLSIGDLNALYLVQSLSQFSQSLVTNSPADVSNEQSNVSFQGFSLGSTIPNRKSRRKSQPFPISLVSKVLQPSDVKNESFNNSWEDPATERKKKKQRGMGTIPCPQCDSIFSEQRYLRDHLRRKHEKIECPVCGDTNFYSYRGVQKHLREIERPN